MNVKRKIFIPMISLTIVCGLAVLLSSILLFVKEINDALTDSGADRQPFGFRTLQKIILENHHEPQSVISDIIWDAFLKHQGEQARRDDFELITFKL